MMRTKKIISLICALSMVFSMLTSFTVSAEGAKGIGIEASLSEDGKTLSAAFTADNMEGGVQAFTIEFAVPEGVTKDTAKVTAGIANGAPAGLASNVSDGIFKISYFDPAGVGATFENNVLFTVDMELAEAIADSFTIQLQGKTQIKDTGAVVKVSDETMEATSVVVTNPNAPTPKPTSPARPPQAPVEGGDEEPVPTDVPVSGKGVDLVASIDETNTVITIEAYANEVEGGVQAFTIEFAVPEGVTKDTAKVTAGIANGAPAGLASNVSEGVLKVSYFDPAGVGATFENNLLFTVDMTLPSAMTTAYTATLQGKTQIKDSGAVVKVSDGSMTATSVVVTPATGDDGEEPVKTIALKDYVADDAADAATAAEAEGKDVYVTVDVEKKDGSKAVYGSDFTAVYNGKELTEAEFSNLISGYTEESMADVINGLSFNIYNNDVNKVSTTVNAVDGEGNAEMIADPVEKTLTPAKPTPVPKAPSISVSPTSKTVNTGVKVTVKAEVKNPVEGGVLTATVSEGALDLVTGSGISIGEDQTVIFTGAVKGKIVITYTYTDAEGNELAKEAKSTITIQEKAVTDNTTTGGGGTGNGNGPIANGNLNSGNGGNLGALLGGGFSDLGSVTWAQEAINKLAAMGAISGRGNGIFDPNANITRAEYCQILVNAIGKSQEAADSNFDDVDTNAWYYHSVSVASAYGIVSGYGDGNFGPNNLITRRDMALMTMKAAQVEGVNLSAIRTLTFADADQFEYAAEAVNTLANAGIINGMSATEFAPLAYATRAQAAKIIYDTFVK